jgi:hypothetical protein
LTVVRTLRRKAIGLRLPAAEVPVGTFVELALHAAHALDFGCARAAPASLVERVGAVATEQHVRAAFAARAREDLIVQRWLRESLAVGGSQGWSQPADVLLHGDGAAQPPLWTAGGRDDDDADIRPPARAPHAVLASLSQGVQRMPSSDVGPVGSAAGKVAPPAPPRSASTVSV